MGNFYTNYTLRGPSPQEVAACLAGRSAIVTPVQQGCIVAFDEESDGQNSKVVAQLGSRLSRDLGCPVLAVLNHDDDILWFQFHVNGELVDEYDSSPGYFDPSAGPSEPEGGDAAKLCEAFGSNAVTQVEQILRRSSFEEDGYTFALERHADLVRALGLPEYSVGLGFQYLSEGDLPEGLKESDLIRV